MRLNLIDFLIILLYLSFTIVVGLVLKKQAQKNKAAGYFLAPQNTERIGDVSNVVFSNGWVADPDGKIFIYYASSDTRIHVATTTIDRLLDYAKNTPEDGLRSAKCVEQRIALIEKNKQFFK